MCLAWTFLKRRYGLSEKLYAIQSWRVNGIILLAQVVLSWGQGPCCEWFGSWTSAPWLQVSVLTFCWCFSWAEERRPFFWFFTLKGLCFVLATTSKMLNVFWMRTFPFHFRLRAQLHTAQGRSFYGAIKWNQRRSKQHKTVVCSWHFASNWGGIKVLWVRGSKG